jgi:hypothetical protein
MAFQNDENDPGPLSLCAARHRPIPNQVDEGPALVGPEPASSVVKTHSSSSVRPFD